MRRINLSPEYVLPTNFDYDDVIEDMQRDVEDEGCASYFLATVRNGRRSSAAMHEKVVMPLSQHAFQYENVNFGGTAPRTDLSISRGVLSGMMFGHMANEGLHPRMYEADPYRNQRPVNVNLLDMTDRIAYIKAMEVAGDERASAYRMGVRAMASTFLSGLNEPSMKTLVSWADEMVGEDRRSLFVNGFGTALYLAWDAYSDIFQETNREAEIFTFPALRGEVNSGTVGE